jgi:hypothetical protein
MRWDRRALACALAACTAAAPAQESLCTAGEAVVFSCHAGSKTVSLCRPTALRGQLAYRFGTPGRVELAYPAAAVPAARGFEVATRPLFGGGVTTLRFQSGAYRYEVYSKTGRADDAGRTPATEDGVIVSRNGQTVRHLACDDGGAGFRESLGWLPHAPGK